MHRFRQTTNERRTARPLRIHGWTVFMHPLFLAQLQALSHEVEGLKTKDPGGYTRKNATKRLAAIRKLAFDVIPQDPTRPDYRQGHTLGEEHKHWFRARFFQQYRLFFRFHAPAKSSCSPGSTMRTPGEPMRAATMPTGCSENARQRAPSWRLGQFAGTGGVPATRLTAARLSRSPPLRSRAAWCPAPHHRAAAAH